MWYAFSLISIIIVKLLIDLFVLIYLISIDWTSLQLSSRCVQKSSRNQLFSQSLRRLILYHTILRKCWNHSARSCRNQCLLLLHHLFSHILQQIHDLHLIIFQNYANMLVIYIRFMNILRSSYFFNAGSTVFSMLVLAKL